MSEPLAARARRVVPPLALLVAARRARSRAARVTAVASLVSLWAAVHAKYRRVSRAETAHEYEQLRTASWASFSAHYNERVPTIEEEFEIWGAYHQHRHEMRYDLVASEVRRQLRAGGRVLDVGCGSALVADRLGDVDGTYVGVDYGGHHITYAKCKHDADAAVRIPSTWARCAAERLPFRDASFDVVVMSEVIEHLMRPEDAVWEVARVLRPGGTFVMTTNNASEVPLRTPLTHPLVWVERLAGAYVPSLLSRRPWVWPEPLPPAPGGSTSEPVYVPHTHHIYAETRDLFTAAGLATERFSSFEFPPAQSATAAWLEARGERGHRAVDLLEGVAQLTPGLNKMGAHLLMVCRKAGPPVAPAPPPGIWPGPFS